jgi:uncharacterized protein (TIGR02246 family)
MRLLLLVLTASTLWAQSPADEDAIRSVAQRYFDTREAQQPGALEALLTPDVDQLVSTGEWRKGRINVVQGAMASSRNTQEKRTLAVESIRFVTPDVAICDGRYEISGEPVRKMWSTFVFVRTNGWWRIGAIRNMLPAR